jgi:hypothetical protein
MLLSLWIERDGRAVVRVREASDRGVHETIRVIHAMPELLEAVGQWATPFLADSSSPKRRANTS